MYCTVLLQTKWSNVFCNKIKKNLESKVFFINGGVTAPTLGIPNTNEKMIRIPNTKLLLAEYRVRLRNTNILELWNTLAYEIPLKKDGIPRNKRAVTPSLIWQLSQILILTAYMHNINRFYFTLICISSYDNHWDHTFLFQLWKVFQFSLDYQKKKLYRVNSLEC